VATREIIFDTETTGLSSSEDRVIEIGGVELEDMFPTGRTIHLFFNPEDRKVHPDALAIHGITNEFLQDKPTFSELADEILSFFDGAKWVAHNATFDMGFINAELARIGQPPILDNIVIDTLAIARRKHPMGPNSLDALCRRYGIDNSHRTFHGALLDSQLLAEVYIEMNGGRQASLGLDGPAGAASGGQAGKDAARTLLRQKPLNPFLSTEEKSAHEAMVAEIGEKAVWNKY
jgi:DNA polymerase-3 subunit epsilon